MRKVFGMEAFEGWNISLPLIQGGMGVGVSLGGLAGAVAAEGGIGMISTAQIGFGEPDFVGNELECNLRGIRKQIARIGADGVQAATRFVATEECDASREYKLAYVNAKETDVEIIKSPVGMPGRALANTFIRETEKKVEKIQRCYHCIKGCNPGQIPYCITKALVAAVKGDVEQGLVFCGSNVGKIKEISTVHEVVEDLMYLP